MRRSIGGGGQKARARILRVDPVHLGSMSAATARARAATTSACRRITVEQVFTLVTDVLNATAGPSWGAKADLQRPASPSRPERSLNRKRTGTAIPADWRAARGGQRVSRLCRACNHCPRSARQQMRQIGMAYVWSIKTNCAGPSLSRAWRTPPPTRACHIRLSARARELDTLHPGPPARRHCRPVIGGSQA